MENGFGIHIQELDEPKNNDDEMIKDYDSKPTTLLCNILTSATLIQVFSGCLPG
jgi:hypothetical protein